MKIKKTKEELIFENAQLTQNLFDANNKYNDLDQKLRENLGNILCITGKPLSLYDSPRTPEWCNIYAEIGALMATNRYKDLREEIHILSNELNNLMKRVDQLNTPNHDNKQ